MFNPNLKTATAAELT